MLRIFFDLQKKRQKRAIIKIVSNNRETMFNVVHPAVWEELNAYSFMKIIDKLYANKIVYWIYKIFLKK